jgi:two-component system sensor histidine kinase/response regulator
MPVEKKSKILIVDDNVDAVELLEKRLRSEGYNTADAYDGEEGLKKVLEYNPDLIILDVMMPKLDGYEVCKILKFDENTRYIPVLMLTAKSDVESKVKGLDIGADDYLPKPFDYKELSARVRSLLSIKAAHEKLVAEEKTGALEQMMDQVAHEIRNPLTSIGGFARKVYGKLPGDDPNKKYMEMIIENVAVLESMIKQLIELKTMAISFKESTNINDVIMEALKIFEQEFGQKAINVETELKDSLPPIIADKNLLRRALCNLIKNSIEAMVEETRVLKIVSRMSEDHVEIQVSDTGRGISKDKLKNIFDPFVTSKVYGPGLGLTFTLKIIQDHNGTISVESEPDKGTTFTIRFPIKTN